MKLLLILILSLSFTLTAFGQDYTDSSFTNKAEAKNLTVNSLKEGKWLEYIGYDDTLGAPYEEDVTGTNKPYIYYRLTVYKTGKPSGIVRQYYKDGVLKKETPFINGRIEGIEKTYYDNGKLYSETPYTSSQINGDVKEYYMSGRLLRVITYSYGIQRQTKKYDDNGNEIKH